VSRSAYDAAQDYWPELFATLDDAKRAGILAGLKQTRPVLVRGYECMVMVGGYLGGFLPGINSALALSDDPL
jgi:hypothetical protein